MEALNYRGSAPIVPQAGWRRVFTPSARTVHRDGGAKSTSQASKKMFVQMQKSTYLSQEKPRPGRVVADQAHPIGSNFVRMVTRFAIDRQSEQWQLAPLRRSERPWFPILSEANSNDRARPFPRNALIFH